MVGQDSNTAGGDRQSRIEKRDLTDGSLVWSEISDPSGGHDDASAVDGSGAGNDNSPGNREWRIEKRVPSESLALVDAFVVKAPEGSVYYIYPSTAATGGARDPHVIYALATTGPRPA